MNRIGCARVSPGGFVVGTGLLVADVFSEAGLGDVLFSKEFLGVAGGVLGGDVGSLVNTTQWAASVRVVGEGIGRHGLLDFEEFAVGAVCKDFLVEVDGHGTWAKDT